MQLSMRIGQGVRVHIQEHFHQPKLVIKDCDCLGNFNNFENIPKYSLFFFTIFFDLEEMIFENFNIFENNIISVKLAKVVVNKINIM